MSLIQIIMQVILIGFTSFGISAVVEWYKKTLRKDKAKVWEIRAVAAALSALGAVGFKITGIFIPVISYFFPAVSTWIDALVYAVVIFALQLADMKVLKTIVKFATNNLPTGDKILKDEIKRLINNFDNTTKLHFDKIMTLLEILGVTSEEKVRCLLNDIGVDTDKIDVIVESYKQVMSERNK